MNLRLTIIGAVSGFLAAVLVDLNAFSKAPGAVFDFKLAFGRWLTGAITGAMTGLTGAQA